MHQTKDRQQRPQTHMTKEARALKNAYMREYNRRKGKQAQARQWQRKFAKLQADLVSAGRKDLAAQLCELEGEELDKAMSAALSVVQQEGGQA